MATPKAAPARTNTSSDMKARTKKSTKKGGKDDIMARVSNSKGAKVFKPYDGDMFGTRGDYEDGLIYASRMPPPGSDTGSSKAGGGYGHDPLYGTGSAAGGDGASTFHGDAMSPKAGDASPRSGANEGVMSPKAGAGEEVMSPTSHSHADAFDGAEGDGVVLEATGAGHGDGASAVSGASEAEGVGHFGRGERASLMHLSMTGDLNMKRSCAAALKNMSSREGQQAGMVTSGAVQALLTLHETPDEGVQGDCLTAICNILRNVPLRDIGPMRKGAVAVIFAKSGTAPTPALRAMCMDTMVHLSAPGEDTSSTDGQMLLVDEGAVAVVGALGGERESGEACNSQAILLNNLADVKRNRLMLVHQGAVATLLDIVKRAGPTPAGAFAAAQTTATSALARMIHHKDTPKVMIQTGIVGQLVPLIVSPVQTTAVNALQALVEVAKDAEGRIELMAASALAPLIDVSKATAAPAAAKARKAAPVESAKDSEDAEAKAKEADESDDPPPKAKETEESDDPRRDMATEVLRELSVDPVCRTQLIDEGAVPALVLLSGAGNTRAERNCAVALCSLLLQQDNGDDTSTAGDAAPAGGSSTDEQTELLKMGALGALAALSRSHDMGLKTKAASTLCDLSCDEQLGYKVVEEGGLNTLATLAGVSPELDGTGAEIQSFCAVAFHNLSAYERNWPALTERSKIVAVLTLAVCSDQEVKRRCAAALSNLTYYTEGLSRLAAAGVLKALVELSKFETAKLRCAVGFCNLSTHQPIRREMVDAGAVPILIGLARGQSGGIKQDCVRALCNLSAEAGIEVPMAREGAASGLIMIALFRSDHVETKELCVRAMFNLMANAESRGMLINDEVVWAFAKLGSSKGVNTAVKTLCAHALCSLSCEPDTRVKILQQKSITSLSLVAEVPSAATRRACAAALRNLTWDSASPSKMVKEGILTALQLLSNVQKPSVTHHVAGALCNLSADAGACAHMADQNVSGVLLQLCQSDVEHVLHCCAVALANLSSLPNALALRRLVEQRAIAALVVVTGSKELPTVALCVQTLYNLSCCQAISDMVIDAAIVRVIVAAIEAAVGSAVGGPRPKRSTDKDAKTEHSLRLCAAAVCNLSRAHGSQGRLVDGGIVSALVTLLHKTCRADTVQFAVHALCNLSSQKDCLATMVDEGVVPVLIETAGLIPPSAGKDQGPVFGITEALREALTRVVVRTLTNLSSERTARPRMAEDGFVGAIVSLCSISPESRAAGNAASASAAAEAAGEGATAAIDEDAWPQSLELVEAASVALWNASEEPSSAVALLDEGMPGLLEMCKYPEIDVRNLCASALVNLSRSHGAKLNTVPSVGPVLAALARSEDGDTKGTAAMALRLLSETGESQAALMEEGGMDMMLQLMMGGEDDSEVAAGAGGSGPVGRAAQRVRALQAPAPDMMVRMPRVGGTGEGTTSGSIAPDGSGWNTVAEWPSRPHTKPLVPPLKLVVDEDAKGDESKDESKTDGAASKTAEEDGFVAEQSPYVATGSDTSCPREGDIDTLNPALMWPKVKEGGIATTGLEAAAPANATQAAESAPAEGSDGDAAAADGTGTRAGTPSSGRPGDTGVDGRATTANARINAYFQPRLRGTWASPVKPLPLHVRLGVRPTTHGPDSLRTSGSLGEMYSPHTPHTPHTPHLTPGGSLAMQMRPSTAPGQPGAATGASPRGGVVLDPLPAGAAGGAGESGAAAGKGSQQDDARRELVEAGVLSAASPQRSTGRPGSRGGTPGRGRAAGGSKLSPLTTGKGSARSAKK